MSDREPLYQVLAGQLGALIRSGAFAAGGRLPSVRQTSREHRLSLSTVTEAYRALEDQGIIVARPRSGYYVAPPRVESPRLRPGKPVRIGQASIFEAVMATVDDARVMPFAAAAPDPSIGPGAKLAAITREILRRHGAEALRYTPPGGRRELRTALSRRLFGAGVTASPEEIVTTQGATEALLLALQATTQRGELVAVESPSYFGTLNLIRELGLKAIEIPVEPERGPVLEALESSLQRRRIRACVVQPDFQNPVGSLMPVARKQQLAALAERYDFTLIEDSVYSDLAHDGATPPSLALYSDRVIHCGSVSKTIAPGLRVGWIAPGRHATEVQRLKSMQAPWNAALSELIVAEFLDEGGYDRHLRRVRRIHAAHCEMLREALQAHFPQAVRISQPRGGFVLWVEMPAAFDAESFTLAAISHGISLVPGTMFSPSCGLGNCFRLSGGFPLAGRPLAAVAQLGRLAPHHGGRAA